MLAANSKSLSSRSYTGLVFNPYLPSGFSATRGCPNSTLDVRRSAFCVFFLIKQLAFPRSLRASFPRGHARERPRVIVAVARGAARTQGEMYRSALELI